MPNERIFRASFQSRGNASQGCLSPPAAMGITIRSEDSKGGTTTQVNFNFGEQPSPPHHYPSTANHMLASRKETITTDHLD